jgi:hypothetical protein
MYIDTAIQSLNAGMKWGRPDPSDFTRDQITSFAEFGFHQHTVRDLTPEQVDVRFQEVRDWIARRVDGRRTNAVFVDTTTLHTAESLLHGRQYLNPATLLGLNSFVNAVVLYDHVFHLENGEVDSVRLNEMLGNEPIIVSLPVSSFGNLTHGDTVNSLGAIFRGIWWNTQRYLRGLSTAFSSNPYATDYLAIKQAWQTVLAMDEIDDRSLDEALGEVSGDNWHSDGPGLLEQLSGITMMASMRFGRRRDEKVYAPLLYETISECNFRCLFNLRVSDFLQLHYLPNSYRLPFQHYIYQQARLVQQELATIRQIETEYRRQAESYFSSNQNNLTLPFFLAGIINKISTLDEFMGELMELRHKAELDEAFHKGNVREAARLRRALSEESNRLHTLMLAAPLAGAVAAILSSLGSATTPMILAAVAVLTGASQFPPNELEKLKKRILYPEYWFMTDLKDVALEMTNAYPKICALWGVRHPDPDGFASLFNRFARLRY